MPGCHPQDPWPAAADQQREPGPGLGVACPPAPGRSARRGRLLIQPGADHRAGFVEGGDARTDHLPLLGTHVTVNVAGVIADVTVRQTYKNDGLRPIHARYVFPRPLDS